MAFIPACRNVVIIIPLMEAKFLESQGTLEEGAPAEWAALALQALCTADGLWA